MPLTLTPLQVYRSDDPTHHPVKQEIETLLDEVVSGEAWEGDMVAAPAIRRALRITPDIFDYSGGVVSDYTAAFNTAITDLPAQGLYKLYFPGSTANYNFAGIPNPVNQPMHIFGDSMSQTTLSFSGVAGGGNALRWTGANGVGGSLRDISIGANIAGAQGGTAVMAVTDADKSPDFFYCERVNVSGFANSRWQYAFVYDGTLRLGAGASGLVGLRGCGLFRCLTFNTDNAAVSLRHVRLFQLSGLECNEGVGANHGLVITGPSASFKSSGLKMSHFVVGNVSIDNTAAVEGGICDAQNVTFAASADTCNFHGPRGTLTNSSISCSWPLTV